MHGAPACPYPSSWARLPITQTESTHTHCSGTAPGPLPFQPVPTCSSSARPTPSLTPDLNVQLWTSGSQRPTPEAVSKPSSGALGQGARGRLTQKSRKGAGPNWFLKLTTHAGVCHTPQPRGPGAPPALTSPRTLKAAACCGSRACAVCSHVCAAPPTRPVQQSLQSCADHLQVVGGGAGSRCFSGIPSFIGLSTFL